MEEPLLQIANETQVSMLTRTARWKLLIGTMIQPINGIDRQLFGLDILRGLAALTIIVWHYKNFFRGTQADGLTFADLEGHWMFGVFNLIIPEGFYTVALFWMISGFVFMLVYAGQGRSLNPATYAMNRFSRLYPLHFATLIYVAGLQAISLKLFDGYQIYEINDLPHFVRQIFFVSDWGFEEGFSFNGPIWSVSAEIFAYIAFLIYVPRIPINLLTLIAVFSSAFFCAVVTDLIIVLCLTYFFGGCIIYAIFQIVLNHTPRARPMLAIFAFCIFAVLDQGLAAIGYSLPTTLKLHGYFGAMLLAAALAEVKYRNFDLKRFSSVGDITYATYLLHSPIQMTFLIVVALGWVDLNVVLSPVFALSYFAFVIAMSLLVFRNFERPVQNFILKWYHDRRI